LEELKLLFVMVFDLSAFFSICKKRELTLNNLQFPFFFLDKLSHSRWKSLSNASVISLSDSLRMMVISLGPSFFFFSSFSSLS